MQYVKSILCRFSIFIIITFNVISCGGGNQPGNEKFRISSNEVLIVPENRDNLNFALSTLGRKGDGVSFELKESEDESLFNLNSTTGELTKNFIPDFENPIDSNRDNNYQLVVQAKNSYLDISELNLTVKIKNEDNKPRQRVLFPPENSILDKRENVTFRGVITNPDGPVGNPSIVINNNFAEVVIGEESKWSYNQTLPISSHINNEVSLYSSNKLEESTKFQIHNTGDIEYLVYVQMDNAKNRLIIHQGFGLWERDLESGRLTQLCNNYPTILLFQLSPILYDASRNWVFAVYEGGVVSIDLVTCAQKIISNKDVGAGPDLGFNISAMTFGESANVLYVTERSRIFRIDVSTGDRTILSGDSVGVGPDLRYSMDSIMYDPSRSEIYVNGSNAGEILSVDLSDGSRKLIINALLGEQPKYADGPITFDSIRDRFIADGDGELITIDRDSGNRTVLTNNFEDSGPFIFRCNNVVVNKDGSMIYISETRGKSTLALDTSSKTRYFLEDLFGPVSQSVFESVDYVAYDKYSDRIIFFSDYENSFHLFYLRTGKLFAYFLDINSTDMKFDSKRDRVLFVNQLGISIMDLHNNDTYLLAPADNDFSPDSITLSNDLTAYVADERNHSIHELDVITGTTKVISSETIGAGKVLHNLGKLAVDSNNEYLYAFVDGEIISVEISTGNRRVISSNTIGNGPYLHPNGGIYFNSVEENLFVCQSFGLVSVNVDNGDRNILRFGTDNTNYPCNYFDIDKEGNRFFSIRANGIGVYDLESGQSAIIN